MSFDLSTTFHSLQGMATGFAARLPYIAVALIVYALFHLAAAAARRIITRLTQRRRSHRNAGLVLGRLAQGALMLVGVLIGLVIALPSFEPGQLVQLLGISSVAIGFAFRDILQNFLAGILILLTEPFRIGDQIIVGKFEGTVDNIETRATFIRTYDGRRIVIPNSTLFTESVIVNTAFDKRRLQYDIGIGYGDDIGEATTVILETLAGVPVIEQDPKPEVLVVDLAASQVTLRVRWWISPSRRSEAVASTHQVLLTLKAALTEAGIDLPFPTRQILWHDQTEEADGDRSRQREGWPRRQGENGGRRGRHAAAKAEIERTDGAAATPSDAVTERPIVDR